MRREVVQTVEIAKENSEKQNNTTIMNRQTQLYNVRSYLGIAVLIIAILIAVSLQLNSLQSRLEEDTKVHEQNFIVLQQQNALLQEMFDRTVADLHDQLSSSIWSTKLCCLASYVTK